MVPLSIPLGFLPLLCVLIDLITTRPSITYVLVYFQFSPWEWHEDRDVILVMAVSLIPEIMPATEHLIHVCGIGKHRIEFLVFTNERIKGLIMIQFLHNKRIKAEHKGNYVRRAQGINNDSIGGLRKGILTLVDGGSMNRECVEETHRGPWKNDPFQ